MSNRQRPSAAERALIWYARNFPVQRGKVRLIDACWRMAARGGDSKRVADLVYGGYRMPCDLGRMLQRQYYYFGTYVFEKEVLENWSKFAATAEIVVDVGANAGIYSLAAIAANPSATVHAFEPTPEIATSLRATAGLNALSGLMVHEAAVMDREGQAILVRCDGGSDNDGMNFVRSGTESDHPERVTSVALDDFCERLGLDRIDLMKIDVQGHEHTVLRGAERLIAEGRIGIILMELNWLEGNGGPCSATESVGLLERAGYRFSRASGTIHWKAGGPWLREETDIVASQGPFSTGGQP